MAARRALRDAKLLVLPAVERTLAALEPPDSDSALVALVRRQAAVIDAMPDGVAAAMMPNHGGPLLRGLTELEARAAKRRKLPKGAPSQLDRLREARARTMRSYGKP
jgi:hypothetical protein